MTELPAEAASGRDYWETVARQLRRRPGALAAGLVLLLLYGVAVFAPLLANDRPLLIEGTDRDGYRRARTQLVPVAEGLVARANGGEQAYRAWRAAEQQKGATLAGSALAEWQARQADAPRTADEWVALERVALEQRLAELARQLGDDPPEVLAEVSRAADALLAAVRTGETGEEGGTLLALAQQARTSLAPAEPGVPAEPGATVQLVPFRSWPAFAALSPWDLYFMALWLLLLALPLWNRAVDRLLLGGRREAIRRARAPKGAALLLLPLLPAALFAALRPAGDAGSFHVSAYKDGLTRGEFRATTVVFAPIAFGMAEQNHSEAFRPPTWHHSAGMDDEGYYFAGARALRTDPATGMPLPAQPVAVRAGEPPRNATGRHLLGTDSLGRDILARIVWGSRISLSVGLVSTLLLVVIGTVLGAIAGYAGGWTDVVVSRLIEIFQCFPVFFLILIVVAFVGPSVLNIMLAIGLFRWTGVARLVRGEFLRLRGQDFVVASRALGVSPLRTIFRHVLPNALSPVLVAATFQVASGILTESALSYLGFGVKMPVPSWGSLLTETSQTEYWWIQVFPGLIIFVTVMLYNLLGEGVRDALDPRLKEA